MKTQKNRTPVSEELHRQRVRSVAGIMAIEGITLSEASRRHLDRYASGQANFQQILSELKRMEKKITALTQYILLKSRTERF